MSLYEVLVVIALAALGGYAWHLYRSDTRGKPPGSAEADGAEGRPIFERVPRDRAGDAGRQSPPSTKA